DLGMYGLDKPYLRVAILETEKVQTADKPTDKPAKPREHVLLIGKPTDRDAKTRYAKLGDGEAVFVVSEKLATAVDHGALDLLDRNLLTVDPKSIEGVRIAGTGAVALKRQADAWQVTESPAGAFPADHDATTSLLGVLSNLRAQRLAAYGSKVDPKAFGLD